MAWLALASLAGCGFGYRKTNLSSSVTVTEDSTQDIAALQRDDYKVLESAHGQAQTQQWFVLWFPVGTQKTRAELFDDAVYAAIDTVEGCDALLLPHATTHTVVVPLLAVNVVTRRITLAGRCITLATDEQRKTVSN
jgi:hypothetical protein